MKPENLELKTKHSEAKTENFKKKIEKKRTEIKRGPSPPFKNLQSRNVSFPPYSAHKKIPNEEKYHAIPVRKSRS